MLRNWFVSALRALWSNRLYSAINLLGLAVGLAASLLITLFVLWETGWDTGWRDHDRIHRVTREFTSGNSLHLAAVAPNFAPLLANDFAEVEDAVRIRPQTITIRVMGGEPLREDSFALADPSVFEFFDIEILDGDPDALQRPDQLVVSMSAAQRLFGRTDVVGEQVRMVGGMDVSVAAVMADLPPDTHMAFEVLGSIHVLPIVLRPDELERWASNNYYTYLRLAPGADPQALVERFPEFLTRHQGEHANEFNRLHMMPIGDIHLHSDVNGEWQANGSMAVVTTFSAIAVVVLLVACINFMNLTTARASLRAREVGLRKVVGATRPLLVAQFIGESVLLTALAMLLALAMVELALPVFGAFLEVPLSLGQLNAAVGPLWLPLMVLVVGVAAGSYPAFVLSSFQPAAVLRGGSDGPGGALLRKGLVVLQFAVSVAMMVATGVVLVQLDFARNLDLGYDRERNIVTRLPFQEPLWEVWPAVRAALEEHPQITSVTLSSRAPGTPLLDGSNYYRADRCCEREQQLDLRDLKADSNWFEHYRVPLLAGRYPIDNPLERRLPDFSDGASTYAGVAVLSREAARQAGWTPEQAVGAVIREPLGDDRWMNRTVIGVVEDFKHASVYEPEKPVIITELHPNYGRAVSIRLAPGDPAPAIAHIERVMREQLPGEPLNWQFLDMVFDAMYRGEARQAQVFGVFALLAIGVATLGLYGLASFTTARRTREIGIRKVLGAGVRDIVLLLTREFSGLVLIGMLVAWPVAWWLMGEWLTRFVYQTPMPVWVFLASGALAFAVAWITVAAHAARAATVHPVTALRVE